MKGAAVVFDIGGTNMRVANISGGVPGDVVRAPTPASPVAALQQLAALIREAAGERVEHIVGGVAGVMRSDGTLSASPHLAEWEALPLTARLGELFSVHVHVFNDVELATLGEAVFGAGQDARIVAQLRVGTGVGSSRVVNGAFDAHSFGFEAGHQVVNVDTGQTLESIVGGAAIQEAHGAAPETLPESVYEELTPVLAAGVWNAIVHWSPDVFVLGGSLMNEQTGFRIERIVQEVEKLQRVVPVLPVIKAGVLGDAAGLYGAAAALRLV